MKPRQVNFCPGELILKLLAWIGECQENLNEKTGSRNQNSNYKRLLADPEHSTDNYGIMKQDAWVSSNQMGHSPVSPVPI